MKDETGKWGYSSADNGSYCDNVYCFCFGVVQMSKKTQDEEAIERGQDTAIVRHDTLEETVSLMFREKEAMDDPENWFVNERDSGDGNRYSVKEYLDVLRKNKCWGFYRRGTNVIHVWIDDEAEFYDMLFLFAHEFGHVEPPSSDDVEEQSNAYGRVAVRALSGLLGTLDENHPLMTRTLWEL